MGEPHAEVRPGTAPTVRRLSEAQGVKRSPGWRLVLPPILSIPVTHPVDRRDQVPAHDEEYVGEGADRVPHVAQIHPVQGFPPAEAELDEINFPTSAAGCGLAGPSAGSATRRWPERWPCRGLNRVCRAKPGSTGGTDALSALGLTEESRRTSNEVNTAPTNGIRKANCIQTDTLEITRTMAYTNATGGTTLQAALCRAVFFCPCSEYCHLHSNWYISPRG